ncbi:GntR family transcriptional regulator [Yinghuangia sp. ASG 101]|uniref:GntR family transcriptional regulator n=1 Tax=Yinghuangia sp. ASG 101 TaxID=2896848 RepID=UPI001E28AB01|nr:GntR family transcriptional regulator [Yinghuangia sp. ASG 101]UGQ09365.1 GntR family transcriptional regulator [Yinghuangia sp. ASG 101]
MALQRPENLWTQVADDIRARIGTSEYPPGTKLPSEAAMIAEYGVSRPVVRQAIAALRAEGIVKVEHGRGAYVREQATPTGGLDRRVTRTGTGATARHHIPDAMTAAEEPSRYRTTTDATTGPLLGVGEGEAAFGADRLMVHQDSGARVLHRTVIPFATADGTALESDPHRPPAEIYDALTAAGHRLTWTEHVSARMPTPDEATALRLAAGVPVLIIRRVTHSDTAGPLLYEETRAAADVLHADYQLTAETTKRTRSGV